MNDVVTQEAPRHALTSGGAVKAIVPQDFEGAWRIARAVTDAGMAPKGLEKPEQAMVAILHGLEVGFTPMAALQSIAVVNGRPSIWGDGALALVQSSGLLEEFEETITGGGEQMEARCEVKRRGKKPKVGTFSVSDAKTAGLWRKQGPWTQYPKRMLQMRARAFALRDAFADILRGLSIAEEQADVERMKDVTPSAEGKQPPQPPKPPVKNADVTMDDGKTIDHVADAEDMQDEREEAEEQADEEVGEEVEADAETGEVQDDESSFDPDAFLDNLQRILGDQTTAEGIEEAWDELDVEATLTTDSERLEVANSFKAAALKKVK